MREKSNAVQEEKSLYIIDGDLHMLNGDIPNHLRGLYVLPRYCVENYLFFSETAICETADEEEPEIDLSTIQSTLNFDNWVSDNENLLLELFIIYAICFKHILKNKLWDIKFQKL